MRISVETVCSNNIFLKLFYEYFVPCTYPCCDNCAHVTKLPFESSCWFPLRQPYEWLSSVLTFCATVIKFFIPQTVIQHSAMFLTALCSSGTMRCLQIWFLSCLGSRVWFSVSGRGSRRVGGGRTGGHQTGCPAPAGLLGCSLKNRCKLKR